MPRFLVLLALLISLAGVPHSTAAQDASPIAAQDASPFADLGLPEIAATITDDAIDGVASELNAGRYLLTVTNDTALDSAGVAFMQVPDGMTTDELIGILAEFAAATEMMAPPEWYYEANLAGGIAASAGETTSAVVDLAAGDWIVWGGDPSAPQAPVALTVSGEMPADLPEPVATATITMDEMFFTLDGELTAGTPIIKLTNAGEQPHFLYMDAVPDGATPNDFLDLMASFMDPAAAGTPTAFGPEQYIFTAATGDLSTGATMWLSPTLSAGNYQVVCFVPDIETGAPHVMLGMIDIFTVE